MFKICAVKNCFWPSIVHTTCSCTDGPKILYISVSSLRKMASVITKYKPRELTTYIMLDIFNSCLTEQEITTKSSLQIYTQYDSIQEEQITVTLKPDDKYRGVQVIVFHGFWQGQPSKFNPKYPTVRIVYWDGTVKNHTITDGTDCGNDLKRYFSEFLLDPVASKSSAAGQQVLHALNRIVENIELNLKKP